MSIFRRLRTHEALAMEGNFLFRNSADQVRAKADKSVLTTRCLTSFVKWIFVAKKESRRFREFRDKALYLKCVARLTYRHPHKSWIIVYKETKKFSEEQRKLTFRPARINTCEDMNVYAYTTNLPRT